MHTHTTPRHTCTPARTHTYTHMVAAGCSMLQPVAAFCRVPPRAMERVWRLWFQWWCGRGRARRGRGGGRVESEGGVAQGPTAAGKGVGGAWTLGSPGWGMGGEGGWERRAFGSPPPGANPTPRAYKAQGQQGRLWGWWLKLLLGNGAGRGRGRPSPSPPARPLPAAAKTTLARTALPPSLRL
jgi:hypothetical protein